MYKSNENFYQNGGGNFEITPYQIKRFRLPHGYKTDMKHFELIDILGHPFVAASELAHLLDVSVKDVIKRFYPASTPTAYQCSWAEECNYFPVLIETQVNMILVEMIHFNKSKIKSEVAQLKDRALIVRHYLFNDVYPAFYQSLEPVISFNQLNSNISVRSLIIDGEPWFIAKDVCDILGHTNVTMALNSLDDDEKSQILKNAVTADPKQYEGSTTTPFVPISDETDTINIINGEKKSQILKNAVTADPKQCLGSRTTPFVPIDAEIKGINIINESGLYNLIFSSRKPAARAFRRWVTHEVLPSIRKTGYYCAFNLFDQFALTESDRKRQIVNKEFNDYCDAFDIEKTHDRFLAFVKRFGGDNND